MKTAHESPRTARAYHRQRTGGARSVATDALFTGKPHVDGLGYAFLFRNYRPTLGKWQTADPLGYPDGWNQLAYCGNNFIGTLDPSGCKVVINSFFDALNHYAYGYGESASIGRGIMLESRDTVEYQEIIELLTSILAAQPYNISSGSFHRSGSFEWEQGLVLGRNTMHWSITINWTATRWELAEGGNFMWRELNGNGLMLLSTEDDWDFEVHEGDSFLRSVFGEIIPDMIASLYSILLTSETGEPYHMSGNELVNESVWAYQFRPLE